MIRRPPRSTRTDTLFPYTTLFRSGPTRERHLQNKVSDGRDKDRHLPGPLFGGPAVLRHRVHGPLALREHGNLSRRGIETDRDDADPGRFRGLDGEVPVSTDLGRCRTAVARAFGPKPSSRSEPKDLAMRSDEHTSELQSLMRTSYAVFCLKTKTTKNTH